MAQRGRRARMAVTQKLEQEIYDTAHKSEVVNPTSPLLSVIAAEIAACRYGGEITQYQRDFVPAPLQTNDYMRTLFEARTRKQGRSLENGRQAAQQIGAHMYIRRRRGELIRTSGVEYAVFIGAAVLRVREMPGLPGMVIGPEVQKAQIESLINDAESPDNGISIRVVPEAREVPQALLPVSFYRVVTPRHGEEPGGVLVGADDMKTGDRLADPDVGPGLAASHVRQLQAVAWGPESSLVYMRQMAAGL